MQILLYKDVEVAVSSKICIYVLRSKACAIKGLKGEIRVIWFRWKRPVNFWEYTVNSFSWRNGDRPSFLLATISEKQVSSSFVADLGGLLGSLAGSCWCLSFAAWIDGASCVWRGCRHYGSMDTAKSNTCCKDGVPAGAQDSVPISVGCKCQ